MRASSVAVVLIACLSIGIAAAEDAAPQCAVDCASSIRNANGSLNLKTICADKLRTNSLFQCLISSCPQDTYGPAVSHVVLACSNLGLGIGPLFPVEVQHIDLEKPPYHPTPSLPAAYSTPSDDTSLKNTEHLTLSFDISLNLKCNSGSDGLVTVSLPPPTSSPSLSSSSSPASSPPDAPSPTPPSPSPPTPDPENVEGEGEGDGSNGSANGNEKPTISSSPAEQTPTTPEPADPNATSSCPPDSTPSDVQAPGDEHTGDEHAPPQSTELGEHGNPAPSPTPPNGDDPSSPSSETPCSTASGDAGGSDPKDTEDHSQPLPSPSPTQEASGQPNDDDEPDVSATSDVDGIPAPAPVPATPTPAPASSPCSTTYVADVSVDPILGSQVPQPTGPTHAAQASSPPCSTSPTPTSLMEPEPLSTIHHEPLPLPSPSPPSYQTGDDSGDDLNDDSGSAPPKYASSGGSGQSPAGETSGSEASLPESNTEPPPQESHGTEVDDPSSYGQESQIAPVSVPVPASQANDLAVQDADGKPTGKTTEPSEITLWPTATSNHTSCTTGPAKENGSPTTSCKIDGKRTTVHPPRTIPFNMVKDALPIGDNQQNEPLGSAMIKIIRPGGQSAETILTTLWENAPPAVTLSRILTEGLVSKESGHASATQSSAGSNSTAKSTANAGHHHVGSSISVTHTGLTTSRPKPDHSSMQPNSTEMEPSPPRVALVSSDSKLTPYLCVMTLLVALTS
ncbi:hypothetical protein TGAMA5MH_07854 [Trichoderma gamsii]|uniref:Extracellular membrane protein CFEM domain-containing protein n=1 Tax=Trichoderma gamsii TaxID=398673 RepID=A0A2K0T3V6_9HYPO|nr:hypothetical protein TGAMA5MH_07854 [Trichoderma gamsii]